MRIIICLILIISLIGVIYSDTNTTDYAQRLSVCTQIIVLTGEYQVIDSGLNYGKWVRKQFDSEEIQSPQGNVYNQNHFAPICSAGREYSPTGTDGFVKIQEITTKTIWTIRWDRQFVGVDTYSWDEYDKTKLQIVHYQPEKFFYQFLVEVKE